VTERGTFDGAAFYAALDAVRQARKMTGKQVAAAAGVSASTLTRMAQGRRPDVNSLAALAAWADLSTDDFVRRPKKRSSGEPLAMISTYLRSDPHLSPQAATALEDVIKALYRQLRSDR
jgi:transcriptional regulator with XRE-family HTH domain